LRLTGLYRYRFANDSDMTQFRILDAMIPQNLVGSWTELSKWPRITIRILPIVARFTDTNTGKPTVIIAESDAEERLQLVSSLLILKPSQLVRAIQLQGTRKIWSLFSVPRSSMDNQALPKMEASYFW